MKSRGLFLRFDTEFCAVVLVFFRYVADVALHFDDAVFEVDGLLAESQYLAHAVRHDDERHAQRALHIRRRDIVQKYVAELSQHIVRDDGDVRPRAVRLLDDIPRGHKPCDRDVFTEKAVHYAEYGA